ncbi:MAG TPA: PIG-L family deacetylase [Dermatophilaceae bacterium]|jgi:LmbE family N-acetylglucosaminyl deacetylase|nr:PIG-L family deacetylase [Dermatophilaceae bacterium]HMT90460.1 PIG-L family deacetylase [Dermatophilaceae bacterium]
MSEPTTPAALEPIPEQLERVLVVVAHPDDIEYGTAAAVDVWTSAGVTVTYLLATRGEAGIDGIPPEQAAPLRAQEEVNGALRVGVEVVEFLDHQDGVVEYGLALRKGIAREIRRRRPDIVIGMSYETVFAGGMTNQADHRAVGLAAVDAVRDAANRWIFRDLAEQEGLEPWSGVAAVYLAVAEPPTHYVDVTGHLEPAVASLEAHAEYNRHLPDAFPKPRELVTGILTRGAAAVARPGVEHAVLFRRYPM